MSEISGDSPSSAREVDPRSVTAGSITERGGEVMGPLPDGGPRPIDPTPPYDSQRFVVDVDWSIRLSDEAQRRIERQMRALVLAEVAQVDVEGDLIVRGLGSGQTRGLQVMVRR